MERVKSQKLKLGIFIILLVVFSISFVSATHIPVQCNDGIDNDLDGKIDFPDDDGCDKEFDRTESKILGYADGCFVKGDSLHDVFGRTTFECKGGKCFACVLMTEAGNYTTLFSKCRDSEKCSFSGSGGGGGSIDLTPPELTINSPVQDEVYGSRRVLFDLSTDELASLYWIDNLRGRGRWRRLASRTTSYFRKISFRDGLNDITIKAIDKKGNLVEVVRQFYVDSKKPRIRRTYPRRGFANGLFEVEFSEENPETLILHYGNNNVGMRETPVDLDDCTESRRKTFCGISVDLTDYDGQSISYWFELTDIAGSSHQSRPISLKVDITPPVILNDPFWTQGTGRNQRYIYFDLEIDEQNFDDVKYYDNSERRPRWRRICSRLRDDRCTKRVNFRRGSHSLDVQVTDDAGNAIGTERVEFVVV